MKLKRVNFKKVEKSRCYALFPGLLAVLFIGALLRMVWVGDMEYKEDEQVIAGYSLGTPGYERYPWVGVVSGVGIPNPGMSVWLGEAAGTLFQFKTPIDIARWIQVMSVLALLGLAIFAVRVVPQDQQNAWLWGFAFMAVSPIAVLFARKIWSPSIYPVLSLVFLWGWWMRHRTWGAFLWGAFGMVLGQIHLSGFFWVAALWGWTFIFGLEVSGSLDKDRLGRSVWLRGWFVGSIVGALPLIPWVYFSVKNFNRNGPSRFNWMMIFQSSFWRYWVTDSVGVELSCSLRRTGFLDFLRYPLIAGNATYFVGSLHVLLIGILSVTLLKTCLSIWKNRVSWKPMIMGAGSSTAFVCNAAFLGFGGLISLTGFCVQHHYLMVLFPLQWIWISRQVLLNWKSPVPVLVIIFVAQLLITVSFLVYIHQHHGSVDGDYGMAYQDQLKN